MGIPAFKGETKMFEFAANCAPEANIGLDQFGENFGGKVILGGCFYKERFIPWRGSGGGISIVRAERERGEKEEYYK
jgi:hypothetical protein